MLHNTLALSAGFFKKPSTAAWASAREAGITEAELVLSALAQTEVILEKAAGLQKVIADGGVRVTSIHLPFSAVWDVSALDNEIRRAAIQNMEQLLDWADYEEIGIAVLHPSYEPIGDNERPERLKRSAESIEELSDYARKRSVRIAVENLPRTCLGNCADEVRFITNNGENAGVCMDVNHLLKETHRQFIEKLGHAIISTHLSDYDRIDEKHWMIGNGCIDWKELLVLFHSIRYTGRFLFELGENDSKDPRVFYTPYELVRRFRQYTKIGLAQ